MNINVDLSELERAAASINGESYVAGFDSALAGEAFNSEQANRSAQPAMYEKGFHYGLRLKQERPGC